MTTFNYTIRAHSRTPVHTSGQIEADGPRAAQKALVQRFGEGWYCVSAAHTQRTLRDIQALANERFKQALAASQQVFEVQP